MEKHHKKVKKKTSRKKIKLTQASEPDSTSSRKKKRGTSPPANDGGEGRRRRRRRTKRWRAINEKRTKEESLMKRAIRDWPCITKSDKSSASFRCDDGVFHTLGTTWATWSDPTWPIRICWWPFGNREKVKRGRSQPMRRARGRSRRWKAPMGEGRPTIIYSFDSEWSVLCAFFFLFFSFLFFFFSLFTSRSPLFVRLFLHLLLLLLLFWDTTNQPPLPLFAFLSAEEALPFQEKKKEKKKKKKKKKSPRLALGLRSRGGFFGGRKEREREREMGFLRQCVSSVPRNVFCFPYQRGATIRHHRNTASFLFHFFPIRYKKIFFSRCSTFDSVVCLFFSLGISKTR